MNRRSMLGRFLAIIAGLFGVKQIEANGSIVSQGVTDTTSMHAKVWRTKEPTTNLHPTYKCTEIDLLEIVHEGSSHDGYPTFVKINGRMLGGPNGINPHPRWEKAIYLSANVDELLTVLVEYADESVEVFLPKRFDFTLEDVRVQIHPDRYPCKIWVGGYQPRVKSLNIEFVEGEPIDVRLVFLPGIGHSQE